MVQSILIAGTILASSVGCALAALVLGSAIKSAWKRPQPEQIACLEFADTAVCEFRGYDSPELYRDDSAIRSRHASYDQNLH